MRASHSAMDAPGNADADASRRGEQIVNEGGQIGGVGRLRAFVNVVSNWGAFGLSAIVNFLLSPFVVHSLGNDAYGVWILLSSLVGYLGLLDLGVRGAVTKFVATHHAAGNHARASRIASAAFAIFGFAGALAILVSFLVGRFGLEYFEVSPEFMDVAPTIILIGGVTIAISIVSGVYGGIIVARQRFDLLNVMTVVVTLLRAASVVWALRNGGGLLELAWIQLGASAIQGVVSVGIARNVYPDLSIRPTGFGRDDAKMIFSFGLYASLLHIASSLVYYTDSVVIGAYLPVSLITFFAIAANLVDQARALVSGIAGTITPMAGALEGQDEMERVSGVLVTGGRFATLVALPVALTFILRGHTFIGLWMGPEYAEPAGDVLVLLAIGFAAGCGFHIATATLIGINKHPGLVPVFVLEAIANIGLSIALIDAYGIYGVAIGTFVPRLFVTVVLGPWYVRRAVGTPMLAFWGHTLVRPGLAMMPFALGSFWVERTFAAPNLVVYFAQVGVTCVLAAVGAWFVGLTPEERQDYGAAILARIPARSARA